METIPYLRALSREIHPIFTITEENGNFRIGMNFYAFRILIDDRHFDWLCHAFQDVFERHCVNAAPSRVKKLAITRPFSVFVGHIMRIIIALHGDAKGMKFKTFAFLSVSFCFFNFANHAVIHGPSISFRKDIVEQKAHANIVCLLICHQSFLC